MKLRLKHHKTTIALVAAAVLLTGMLLWDRGLVSTGEADLRSENLLDAWRIDDVTLVEVTSGDEHLELRHERDADQELTWMLYEDGKKLDGDDLEMSQYISNIELGLFERKVEDIDPAQTGFDAPRATIVVHMASLRYVLTIGGEAPQPVGGAYIRVEGGARGKQDYVIDQELEGELLVDADELRSKRLSMLLSPSVESYTVGGPHHFKLRRGSWGGGTSGAFLLEHETLGKVRAGRREMDLFLKAVGRVEVTRIVPLPADDPSDAVSVVIEPLKAGAKVHVVVGSAPQGTCGEEEAIAIRREPDPLAGCLPASVHELLRISPDQLVDRHVVGTPASEIIEVRLEGDGKTVDVARKDEGWHMRLPTDGPTEAEPMNDLLEAMLKVEGSVEPSADAALVGLAAPSARVRILGLPERGSATESAPREEKIEVGVEVDGSVWVRRADDGAYLKLTPSSADVFRPRPTLLRATKVIDEGMKYVTGMRLDCDHKRQRVERDPSGAWSLVEPKDVDVGVDGSLAAALVDGIRELTAVRWEAEHALPAHGLEEPWCKVALELTEPDETDPDHKPPHKRELEVLLGGETQGGYFARLSDQDAVFVAPRALGNAARVWLLARTSLLVDIGDIDTVTLSAKDKKLVVRKQGDVWKVDGGPDTLGQGVRAALEDLVAEIVLRRGDATPEEGFEEPALTIDIKLRSDPDAPIRLRVGKSDIFENTRIFLVRRADRPLTYAVAQARLQPLLDAL